jgi:predicted alpha/beta-fold hydrolase
LLSKLNEKKQLFPGLISDSDINAIDTLKDFDDIYTSKAHGFVDANDYYEKCSCLQFLPNISIPSLLLNAKNDSFLGADCYPFKEAIANKNLHLEVPEFGGHVGFWGRKNISYAERRGVEFLNAV